MADKMSGDDPRNYISMIVFTFLGLGAFIIAIVGAYFGGVGLFFGQAIVNVDVFEDKYKYNCGVNSSGGNIIDSSGVCSSYNESDPTGPYTDLGTFENDLNATLPQYINATSVIFSLLALVFLFLALRSAGLFQRKDSAKVDEY